MQVFQNTFVWRLKSNDQKLLKTVFFEVIELIHPWENVYQIQRPNWAKLAIIKIYLFERVPGRGGKTERDPTSTASLPNGCNS